MPEPVVRVILPELIALLFSSMDLDTMPIIPHNHEIPILHLSDKVASYWSSIASVVSEKKTSEEQLITTMVKVDCRLLVLPNSEYLLKTQKHTVRPYKVNYSKHPASVLWNLPKKIFSPPCTEFSRDRG